MTHLGSNASSSFVQDQPASVRPLVDIYYSIFSVYTLNTSTVYNDSTAASILHGLVAPVSTPNSRGSLT